MQKHFAIIDVGFNCVYLDGLDAMVEIATLLNETGDAQAFKATADAVSHSMRTELLHENGSFYSYDIIRNAPIAKETWNIFMPLFAGLLKKNEVAASVQRLQDTRTFNGPSGLRTVSQQEPSYDPINGFWRGPTWFAPYWFIVRGLKRYGQAAAAEELKLQALQLIEKSGFREHYDPETGNGYGAKDFTWAGLILDM